MNDILIKIASESNRNPLDVYHDIYEQVFLPTAEEERPGLLKELMETTQSISYDRRRPAETLDEEAADATVNKYVGILREMVQSLMGEDPGVDEFYVQLWNCIKNPFFKQDQLTMTVLLYMLGEKITGIPYYKAEGLLSLSQEEYRKAIDLIEDKLAEGKAMALRSFEQRTETISQLYRIAGTIDAIEGENGRMWTADELRIIFWSVMSRIFEVKGLAQSENDD